MQAREKHRDLTTQAVAAQPLAGLRPARVHHGQTGWQVVTQQLAIAPVALPTGALATGTDAAPFVQNHRDTAFGQRLGQRQIMTCGNTHRWQPVQQPVAGAAGHYRQQLEAGAIGGGYRQHQRLRHSDIVNRKIGHSHRLTNHRVDHKKGPACAGPFKQIRSPQSNGGNVFGLQAFLSVHDIEAHFLAFLQTLETRAGDCTEMHEHVRAIITADKAETLGVIEPLHCTYFTIRHDSLRS